MSDLKIVHTCLKVLCDVLALPMHLFLCKSCWPVHTNVQVTVRHKELNLWPSGDETDGG